MVKNNRYCKYGIWLKTELIKRNITQVELADITGIGRRTISDIMTGRNKKEAHRALIEKKIGVSYDT